MEHKNENVTARYEAVSCSVTLNNKQIASSHKNAPRNDVLL